MNFWQQMSTIKAFAQILTTGLFANVQDNGRKGYKHLGTPQGGFIDGELAKLANEMLGNHANTACIEFFGSGLEIRFSANTSLAIAAYNVSFTVNGKFFQETSSLCIESGSVVKILSLHASNWGYLSVKGGFILEEVMGSCSMMKGVTIIDRISKNMVLPYSPHTNRYAESFLRIEPKNKREFRIMKGPEFGNLPTEIVGKIFGQLHTISSSSSRQAIVLDGPELKVNNAEIPSGYTPIGTIQITPGGKIFILMNDGQTTGGYARIGFLALNDISYMAQIPTGSSIRLIVNE